MLPMAPTGHRQPVLGLGETAVYLEKVFALLFSFALKCGFCKLVISGSGGEKEAPYPSPN